MPSKHITPLLPNMEIMQLYEDYSHYTQSYYSKGLVSLCNKLNLSSLMLCNTSRCNISQEINALHDEQFRSNCIHLEKLLNLLINTQLSWRRRYAQEKEMCGNENEILRSYDVHLKLVDYFF